METKRSILIVDDDITLLKSAETILSGTYAVSLAKSGEQALQLLRRGVFPDMILLDVDMPQMDGYDTFREIAAIEGAGLIPIAFLTGMTAPESEVRGLRLGAVDYITKPFVREILLARLELHLKTSEQRRLLQSESQNQAATGLDEEKFEHLAMTLTDTERKIARLIALGYTNQEIGEKLFYSYSYVKKVVVVIFEKLGVSKRNELRRLFAKRGN